MFLYILFSLFKFLCTSQFQNRPSPPRAIPGHLTRVKLRTLRKLTQNEARQVGHLTSMSKRLSAVGSKRISHFFLIQYVSRVHGSLLLSIPSGFFCCCPFYTVISWTMPLFKVWSEDKLNKKFVVAENFAELVSKGKRFCLYSFVSWVTCLKGGGFDPLWSSNGWGIWPSKLAT